MKAFEYDGPNLDQLPVDFRKTSVSSWSPPGLEPTLDFRVGWGATGTRASLAVYKYTISCGGARVGELLGQTKNPGWTLYQGGPNSILILGRDRLYFGRRHGLGLRLLLLHPNRLFLRIKISLP